MKSTHIVTRINTYDPNNTVYFAYSAEQAERIRQDVDTEDSEWIVAQIVRPRNMVSSILFFLAEKLNGN